MEKKEILSYLSFFSITNRQMFSSAKKNVILYLVLGYSVEKTYCFLRDDFARVVTPKTYR